MKNISTLFSLLILLCLFSCGKERCNGVCVEGIVTDFGNGMPIENVLISIYEKGVQLLDTVRTDENGIYTACVDDIGSLSLYRAEIEKEGYWEHHGDEFFESFAQEQEHELRAEAWVRITAENVDSIAGSLIGLTAATIGVHTISLPDYNEKYKIIGNMDYIITYKELSTILPDPQTYEIKVFADKGDTTYLDIKY